MTASAFGELIPPFADRILHIGNVPSDAWRQHYARRGRVWYMPNLQVGAEMPDGAEFDCMVIDLATNRLDRNIDLTRFAPVSLPERQDELYRTGRHR